MKKTRYPPMYWSNCGGLDILHRCVKKKFIQMNSIERLNVLIAVEYLPSIVHSSGMQGLYFPLPNQSLATNQTRTIFNLSLFFYSIPYISTHLDIRLVIRAWLHTALWVLPIAQSFTTVCFPPWATTPTCSPSRVILGFLQASTPTTWIFPCSLPPSLIRKPRSKSLKLSSVQQITTLRFRPAVEATAMPTMVSLIPWTY